MKKLIVAIALVASATCANAMSVDWKYQGVKAQEGYTVYMILGSTAKDTWDNVGQLVTASLGQNGEIYKSGTSYIMQGKLADSSITKSSADYYYVLVNGTSYQVSSVIDGTSMVYDPDNKESSPGYQTTKNAGAGWSAAKTFGGGDVPEPTSAMLILLGVAGLALRRKVA